MTAQPTPPTPEEVWALLRPEDRERIAAVHAELLLRQAMRAVAQEAAAESEVA